MDTEPVNSPKFVLVESPSETPETKINATRAKFTKQEFDERGIIYPGMHDSDVINSFRDLRTSILPRLNAFNSVLQVSAITEGGGASFNAINLAVSCTFDQHRHALLVDCNFEKPSLAKTLDIDSEVGLYDYLTGSTDSITDIICPTKIPRLSVVPSGGIKSEDHIEFFTDENMRIFLEDVRNRYEDRIIIIDAPAMLSSIDAKILSEVTDYSLLVLPYRGAGSSTINKMIKAVGKEKIIGLVLNN